jgi:hypothetical protein
VRGPAARMCRKRARCQSTGAGVNHLTNKEQRLGARACGPHVLEEDPLPVNQGWSESFDQQGAVPGCAGLRPACAGRGPAASQPGLE